MSVPASPNGVSWLSVDGEHPLRWGMPPQPRAEYSPVLPVVGSEEEEEEGIEPTKLAFERADGYAGDHTPQSSEPTVRRELDSSRQARWGGSATLH